VTSEVGVVAGRIARRWYRAKGLTKTISVQRVEQSTGRVTYRLSTVRKPAVIHGRGFLLCQRRREVRLPARALPRRPNGSCRAAIGQGSVPVAAGG